MGDYNRSVITKKGIALMTKTLAGVPCQFTRAASSENRIGLDVDLTEIIELDGVQQSVDLLSIKPINATAVRIEALFENASLEKGYYVEVIGLYAQDPDEGEILYSVTTAKKAEWLPEWNGMSTSSLTFNLIVAVANAAHVSILINPDSLVEVTRRLEKIELRLEGAKQKLAVLENLACNMTKAYSGQKSAENDYLRVFVNLFRIESSIYGTVNITVKKLPPSNLAEIECEVLSWSDIWHDHLEFLHINRSIVNSLNQGVATYDLSYERIGVQVCCNANLTSYYPWEDKFIVVAEESLDWYIDTVNKLGNIDTMDWEWWNDTNS
ncbi:hypothetical protein D7X25_22670 [bacterium 1XD42-8]|nr:hypothetical protein D7X25_22670 [bacterium 1XD42-8]